MEIEKAEKFEIECWEEQIYRDELRNGKVVVIYDTPDEDLLSVVFTNVYNGAELEEAWKAFCGNDPENGRIRQVLWCADVINK